MSDLRIAAQQALEFLEAEFGWSPGEAPRIDALRAALAQRDEPVEPVAWIESPHGAIRANPNYKFTFPSQLLHWQIPLYTAPPQRQPLTDATLWEMWVDSPSDVLRFARAVEKAVWEKNHGQA